MALDLTLESWMSLQARCNIVQNRTRVRGELCGVELKGHALEDDRAPGLKVIPIRRRRWGGWRRRRRRSNGNGWRGGRRRWRCRRRAAAAESELQAQGCNVI